MSDEELVVEWECERYVAGGITTNTDAATGNSTGPLITVSGLYDVSARISCTLTFTTGAPLVQLTADLEVVDETGAVVSIVDRATGLAQSSERTWAPLLGCSAFPIQAGDRVQVRLRADCNSNDPDLDLLNLTFDDTAEGTHLDVHYVGPFKQSSDCPAPGPP